MVIINLMVRFITRSQRGCSNDNITDSGRFPDRLRNVVVVVRSLECEVSSWSSIIISIVDHNSGIDDATSCQRLLVVEKALIPLKRSPLRVLKS